MFLSTTHHTKSTVHSFCHFMGKMLPLSSKSNWIHVWSELENTQTSPLGIALCRLMSSWYCCTNAMFKLEISDQLQSPSTQHPFFLHLWHHFVVTRSPRLKHIGYHTDQYTVQYHHRLLQNSLDCNENTDFYIFGHHIQTYAIRCMSLWWIKGENFLISKSR